MGMVAFMMQNEKIIGWLQAFFSVLVLWGLNYVAFGFSKSVLHANTIVFVCSTFASAALVLLLAGGQGPLVKEALRSIDTWVFGFVLLTGYILLMTLVTFVSSTESSLLQRVSVFFGLLISWLFLGRRPHSMQIGGALLVIFGIVTIFQDIEKPSQGVVLLLLLMVGATEAVRMFVAESHRPHQVAMNMQHDPRAKARVVGFVMFIIAVLFLALFFVLALFMSLNPDAVTLPILPRLSDFTSPSSIFSGLVVGGLLVAPIRLIEFSATKRIKTENFLAVAGLSSLATLFWEWSLSPVTGMPLRHWAGQDILALGLVTLGAVVAAVGRMRAGEAKTPLQKYLQNNPQDVSVIDDTRDLLAHTLEYTKGSLKEASRLLNVPTVVLKHVIEDDTQTIAFKDKVLMDVTRCYRKNVTSTDALTGLHNRASFMAAVEASIQQHKKCAVLYMDLNHFKPVNDTYGHKAGDEVLRIVGQRLNSLASTTCMPARIGGDEFVLLLRTATPKQAYRTARDVAKILERPIKLDNTGMSGVTVNISASMGLAFYPHDAQTASALVAAADEAMYTGKTPRT